MKKIVLFIMIISLLAVNSTYIFADEPIDKVSEIVSQIQLSDEGYISRGECVAAVMKLIGMSEKAAYCLNYETCYDSPPYPDDYDDMKNRGYIIQAIESKVAVGVKPYYNRKYYFYPNNAATVKECLAFMLRCLKDAGDVDWNNIAACAEEVGLLTQDEAAKIDLSEKLSIDVFKGLIDRMVNMNVYLYWKSEHVNKYDDMGNTKVNLDLEINYIEWLNKDMSHFGAKDTTLEDA